MTVLVAHRERCSLGVTLDAAAIADPVAFMRALDEGFREVLEAAPRRPATVTPPEPNREQKDSVA
ncbi:hypothetical protein GCM10009678_14240 [Actinomadura kijaniata]|uniref:O-acyltransferase WSD1 C-terminal domain-containing protein n=2 Tax=Actinomadura TaxID=1988 RepID=A0A7W3LQW4_ACTNM|nr:hypothetical protein [Actinomadura namibiensis]